ncbi:MAG TPA: hypothetical protein DCZ91_23955 [Lachnospiraceae bacterium]|nr:hypothetical protein [Lachnospiraceae bacterium]
MEIVKINQHNLKDINKANQPFEVIGRISSLYSRIYSLSVVHNNALKEELSGQNIVVAKFATTASDGKNI